MSVVALCDSSCLGEALFGGAIVDIVQQEVTTKVEASLQAWQGKQSHITMVVVDELISDSVASANSVAGCTTHWKGKRKVDILYRGERLKGIEVKSVAEEMSLRAWALLKSLAVGMKMLKPMGCESLLPFQDEAGLKVKFDMDVLAKPSLAREEFDKYLKKSNTDSADEVLTLVKEKDTTMQLSDGSWKVEKSILHMLSGDTAEARCKVSVLRILPSRDRYVKPADALMQVQGLITSGAFACAPGACQGSVKHVVSMLTKVGMVVALGL